jgi:hypothetical protein
MNEQEIKQLWKSQPAETASFSADELQARARAFGHRIQRRNRVELAAGAAAIAVYGIYFWLFPFPWIRTGCVLVALGTLVALHQLHRRAGSRTPPAESLGLAHLAFYRAELVRQRDALRAAWRWYVAPFAPGLVVFMWGVERELAGPRAGWRGLLIHLAMVAAALGVVWWNRRAARKLQLEIDALDRQATDPN